jgi:hypothetical protein
MLGGCLILLIVTVMNPKHHHLITGMGFDAISNSCPTLVTYTTSQLHKGERRGES